MKVNNIIGSKYDGHTSYILEFEKDIFEFNIEGYIFFKYDSKDWGVHNKWVISTDNNKLHVTNFERVDKIKRRIIIIGDLIGD